MSTSGNRQLDSVKQLGKAYLPAWILERLRGSGRDYNHGQQLGSDWYDSAYAQSEEYKKPFFQSSYYFLWTVIVDRLRRRGVSSVLDLGCGTGQFAQLLSHTGFTKYRGLDFSNEAINLARSRGIRNFQFEVSDLLKDNWSVDSEDAVVSLEFLEHIHDDVSVLNKVKAGSYVIATVPNFPYVSHVRHFENSSDVFNRYSFLFHDFAVDEFVGNSEKQLFFLFEGIKR